MPIVFLSAVFVLLAEFGFLHKSFQSGAGKTVTVAYIFSLIFSFFTGEYKTVRKQ
jgi:hypothetical protein